TDQLPTDRGHHAEGTPPAGRSAGGSGRTGLAARAPDTQGFGGRHLAPGGKSACRGPLENLSPVGPGEFRAHPRADGVPDAIDLLRSALDRMEWAPGRAVRPRGAQVLSVRHGAVAP